MYQARYTSIPFRILYLVSSRLFSVSPIKFANFLRFLLEKLICLLIYRDTNYFINYL